MKVAVCGSTVWSEDQAIESALDTLLDDHEQLTVITGMAAGADEVARRWAERHGVEVLAECLGAGEYPGPMHAYNHTMIGWKPSLVLAFKRGFDPAARPNGYEPGTEHLIRLAGDAGIAVDVFPPLIHETTE